MSPECSTVTLPSDASTVEPLRVTVPAAITYFAPSNR